MFALYSPDGFGSLIKHCGSPWPGRIGSKRSDRSTLNVNNTRFVQLPAKLPPLDKHFPWAIFQLNTWEKSKEFRKHSIRPVILGCGSLHRSVTYSLVTIKWIKTCRHTVYITVPSRFLRNHNITTMFVCVMQSRARELDPQRQSRESDLQGAPASLLSGEGGFQQGQSVAQTHGAGERAQHQAVDPSLSPPQRHLNNDVAALTLGCSWGGKKTRVKRAGARFPNTDRLLLFVLFSLIFNFFFLILIIK